MSDQYEKLLRPYWARAYEIIPGKSGFPERFKQFNATRQMAMDELAKDTGIEAPPGHEVGMADFFKMYTSGELPIMASQNDWGNPQ